MAEKESLLHLGACRNLLLHLEVAAHPQIATTSLFQGLGTSDGLWRRAATSFFTCRNLFSDVDSQPRETNLCRNLFSRLAEGHGS